MNRQSESKRDIQEDESWDPRNELDSPVKQKISLALSERLNTEYLQKDLTPTAEEKATMIAEVIAQFKEEIDAEDERMRSLAKDHL